MSKLTLVIIATFGIFAWYHYDAKGATKTWNTIVRKSTAVSRAAWNG